MADKEVVDKVEQSPQEEEAEILKKIEEVMAEYDKSVTELTEAEGSYQDNECDLFKILVNNPEPSKETVTSLITDKQLLQVLLRKQLKAFKLLQKLRIMEINYANAVIRAHQTKVKELTDAQAAK